MMDKAELVATLRKTLKVKRTLLSDDDIGCLFDMIDGDDSGVVTMSEFCLFAKGVATTAADVAAQEVLCSARGCPWAPGYPSSVAGAADVS